MVQKNFITLGLNLYKNDNARGTCIQHLFGLHFLTTEAIALLVASLPTFLNLMHLQNYQTI